jgi:hypothetical protein
MEARDMATVDIPGAFVHSTIDNDVYICLDGTMVLYSNQYKRFVATEQGKKVFYVQPSKSLNRTLKVALLFWKSLLSGTQASQQSTTHSQLWKTQLPQYDC